MEKVISLGTWAQQVGANPTTARKWAQQGRIAGATIVGKSWVVPADAPRPALKAGNPQIADLRRQTLERTGGEGEYQTYIGGAGDLPTLPPGAVAVDIDDIIRKICDHPGWTLGRADMGEVVPDEF